MKDCSGLVCYFPATVMLVDDNRRFISAIQENLAYDMISIIYDNPDQALQKICSREKRNSKFNEKLLLSVSDKDLNFNHEQVTNPLFNTNVPPIYETIYDRKRFERIAVIVVDYDMPEINGIEFCHNLKALPSKKIMLTSSADLNTAATAFNDGIINHFVLKDSPSLCTDLNQMIRNLQIEYFRDLSQNFINNFPSVNKSSFSLNDQILAEFFNYICHMKHASEFYLLDSLGSFLLLDFSGNPLWLIVRNEEAMLKFLDIAIDNHAPSRIIKDIENKNKIPFFFTETEQRKSVIDWEQYLYPATKLVGKKDNYYYTLLNDRSIGNLDYTKILSHRGYLSQINIYL